MTPTPSLCPARAPSRTKTNLPLKIESVGFYAPPQIETAEEIAPKIHRSVDWVVNRTGVRERRIANESMAEMAAAAARQCLAGHEPPDLIINASLTPMQLIPDSSIFIQRCLGTEGIPSFSIHATCLSFMVGMFTASNMIAAGTYSRILVVSAEAGSVCRDFAHPESAALIGDGAGAALFTSPDEGESCRIRSWNMSTWPEGAELAEIRGCGTRRHPNSPEACSQDNLFRMRGPRIYRLAVSKMTGVIDEVLSEADMTIDDIDLVVPHQTSGPGVKAISRIGVEPDRVVNLIPKFGNCIAASFPMALATAVQSGRLSRGDHILVLGTGAGLSTVCAILTY